MGQVGGQRRVAFAALLMTAVLAALLGAWFATGWHDVRAQQVAIEDAPVVAASARAGQLARELRGELDSLVEREAARPYFHYQNLFHDPRIPGENVTPSPLASGSLDPLVLGYFQIDQSGQVTTPSLNDQFPQLSDMKHLAEHRAFRDAVAQQLGQQLTPPKGALVATAETAPKPKPVHRHPRTTVPPPPGGVGSGSGDSIAVAESIEPQNTTQTFTIDPSAYTQNTNANMVYGNQIANPNVKNGNPNASVGNNATVANAHVKGPGGTNSNATVGNPNTSVTGVDNIGGPGNADGSGGNTNNGGNATIENAHVQAPGGNNANSGNPDGNNATIANAHVKAPGGNASNGNANTGNPNVRNTATAEPPKPVLITVSSLEWHTLPFEDHQSLIALREVQTPDGNLAQGFVVDRPALTKWLSEHAGDLVVQLQSAADAKGTELIPGWELTAQPNPHELESSVTEAAHVATAFLVRFFIIGAVALLAAMLVVWLVARAERYARERSQFAAAAAHELRTPLAGLQLYGDMLSDGLGDPAKLRDYARRMSEEASRLGRVVSNVLGFSQLERGNLSIDPKPGNVAAALRELAETAQPAMDRAGAIIDLDVPETLEARFDRDALARIVGNLLDNAEKYTRDADDRTIHLAAAPTGDKIEITVRDHGAGVAAPAKLFQAFSRGVTTDGPAGLGLGLALSRSLALAMNGELTFKPGPGATFVLTLPKATGTV